MTKPKTNPRPRKYASASERQAAYRARAPEVCFRAEQKTVETLDRIAETLDQSRADVLLSMTKFALANHDWARFGLTHKPLPFEYGVNPLKTEILERAKLPNGTLVRLQKRGKAYDVITNSTGITWRYLEKAVSEERARNAFDLYTMQRKENPMKTTRAKRKPTPAQLAARERFAEMARSGAFAKGRKRKANPTDSDKVSKGIAYAQKRYKETGKHYFVTNEGHSALDVPDNRKAYEGMGLEIVYTTKAKGRKKNPAPAGNTWLVHLVGKPQSWYATKGSKSAAVRLANMLNRQEGRIKYEVSEADWSRKTNPAKKTVSQKISQLTREGYPNRQAVAIALNEERAGKVRRNPAAKKNGPFYFALVPDDGGFAYGMDERTPVQFIFTNRDRTRGIYRSFALPFSVTGNPAFQAWAASLPGNAVFASLKELRETLRAYT